MLENWSQESAHWKGLRWNWRKSEEQKLLPLAVTRTIAIEDDPALVPVLDLFLDPAPALGLFREAEVVAAAVVAVAVGADQDHAVALDLQDDTTADRKDRCPGAEAEAEVGAGAEEVGAGVGAGVGVGIGTQSTQIANDVPFRIEAGVGAVPGTRIKAVRDILRGSQLSRYHS